MQGCRTGQGKLMNDLKPAANTRKGQFLWMEETDRESYVSILKKKITEGYFNSDAILMKIVEELAPVMADTISNE